MEDRSGDDADVYRPRGTLGLVRMLFKLRYQIVHLHIGGNLTLRLLGLALLCTCLRNKRVVLSFHSGGYPLSPAGQRASPRTLRGFILRRLDRVIGVNARLVEMFKRFGVAADRVRLIYPYALSRPKAETVIPEAVQRFLDAHSPVLISVGLLEREYDLRQQIDALGLIADKFPGAGLILIGSGSLEGELRKRTASKPYAARILLCGDLNHEVTLRVMDECDLLMRTTLYDGDSISVREGLHLGLPVVATDNGMRPAGVDLIPPADLHALAGAILRGLARGRSQPDEHTDGQENIRAVLDLYRELLQPQAF
jgi:glycosyltransferase involved in cell wall biosynthesis